MKNLVSNVNKKDRCKRKHHFVPSDNRTFVRSGEIVALIVNTLREVPFI